MSRWHCYILMKLLRLCRPIRFLLQLKGRVVWADSHWYGPAMMSNGRDGNFKCILMDTYESFEALRCCIRLWIFMSRFGMAMLHPYESAEALWRRRNKVSAAAEWQVVWADSRWYGPSMMSNGRDRLSKQSFRDHIVTSLWVCGYMFVQPLLICIPAVFDPNRCFVIWIKIFLKPR